MLVIDFPENYKDLFRPSKMESKNKSEDVYTKFHKWVLRVIYSSYANDFTKVLYDRDIVNIDTASFDELCPPGKTMSVSGVGICEEDAKKLKDLYIEWARKDHKLTKKSAEKSHMWAHLDIGPREYFKSDYTDEIKPGFIYVDMDRIWMDNDR